MAQDNKENNEQGLFREKTLARISSPEKLTDYLRVTTPGIWIILGVIVLLLGGILVWSTIGTLETTAEVKVMVKDHKAYVVTDGNGTIEDGMPLRILSNDYFIATTDTDEYGRKYGISDVSLPDGSYSGTIVTEKIRPIDFLIENN